MTVKTMRGSLLLSAFLIGLGASAALAQDANFDPKALDGSGQAATPKAKGKKAKAQHGASGPAASQAPAKDPNRQFGELEGWSPGKAPPKPAEKENAAAPTKGAGIGVSPTGNMSVGLPF